LEYHNTQQSIHRRFGSAMNITLHGITQRQKNILNKMWQYKTSEELWDWMDTLHPDDEAEVDVLLELVQLTLMDNTVTCTTDLSMANKLIEKARKKA